jgi:ketosteroid isomerase-like protein
MKSIIAFSFLSLLIFQARGQTSNGKVSSLVAAENYFESLAQSKGNRKAFTTVCNDQSIIFRPDPVKALNFYKKNKADSSELHWKPAFAKISRSGDWGFTTGPYTYKAGKKSAEIGYGQYVSVWRMNSDGVWKLALDLGISHDQPKNEEKLYFADAVTSRYFNQKSEVRLQQREDMIMTSDQLFSSTLKAHKNLAYNLFLGENSRLLFPGHEPFIGKRNITDFLRYEGLTITTEPTEADRALGGDLAYTYGKATITKNKVDKVYNYVRVWEVQEGFKWNVILEIYTPAIKSAAN